MIHIQIEERVVLYREALAYTLSRCKESAVLEMVEVPGEVSRNLRTTIRSEIRDSLREQSEGTPYSRNEWGPSHCQVSSPHSLIRKLVQIHPEVIEVQQHQRGR